MTTSPNDGTRFQHVVECKWQKSQKHSVCPCIEATWCWCNYQQSFYKFINDIVLHSSNRGQLLHFKLTFWNFDPTDSLTESYNVEFFSSTRSVTWSHKVGFFSCIITKVWNSVQCFCEIQWKVGQKNTICRKLSAFRRSC